MTEQEMMTPERSDEDIVAALEALLFTTGEAVKADRLCRALNLSEARFQE